MKKGIVFLILFFYSFSLVASYPFQNMDEYSSDDKKMIVFSYADKESFRPMEQDVIFSPEMDAVEIAMSSMFTQAKDMEIMSFKDYCPDAEAIVESALARLQEKGIALQARCDEIQTYSQNCKEYQTTCEHFKTYPLLDKQFLRCGSNQEEFFQECMRDLQNFAPGRNIDEQCEQQFMPVKEQCERNNNILCDETAFMQPCMSEQERRCQSLSTQEQREACTQSNNCRDMWEAKRADCQQQTTCDRERFMNDCRERLSKGYNNAKNNQEERCKQQANQLWEHAQQNCKTGDELYMRCIKELGEKCTKMESLVQECSSVTPEQMKLRMIEHAKKMCTMMEKYKNGKGGMEEAMMHMMQMRDKIPADKQLMMDKELAKLDAIHTTTENQEKNENIFKKFFRLLGFFKQKEEQEIEQLQSNVQTLDASIQSLTTLSEQVTDLALRESLLRQIHKLEEEKTKIAALAEDKEKGVKESLSGMFTKALSR